MAQQRSPIKQARELAIAVMMEVERERLLVPEAMNRFSFRLNAKDLNFAHELVYGTYRYLPGIDKVIARFCKKPKFPKPIRWILAISIYQLLFLRTPDHAVLNEANKLTHRFKVGGLRGLVNGVLRNLIRADIKTPEAEALPDWLLPEWLQQLFDQQYGADVYLPWLMLWQNRAPIGYWALSGKGLGQDQPIEGLRHAFMRNQAISMQEEKKVALLSKAQMT